MSWSIRFSRGVTRSSPFQDHHQLLVTYHVILYDMASLTHACGAPRELMADKGHMSADYEACHDVQPRDNPRGVTLICTQSDISTHQADQVKAASLPLVKAAAVPGNRMFCAWGGLDRHGDISRGVVSCTGSGFPSNQP